MHPSLKTHKLHGSDGGAWALSVNQKYRITFCFTDDGGVLFLDIGTHDEVY
jgi:plasmid maintenance system killer protein